MTRRPVFAHASVVFTETLEEAGDARKVPWGNRADEVLGRAVLLLAQTTLPLGAQETALAKDVTFRTPAGTADD